MEDILCVKYFYEYVGGDVKVIESEGRRLFLEGLKFFYRIKVLIF